MSSNVKIINASAMPPQKVSIGTNNPMMAGKLTQQQNTALQMALTKTGGSVPVVKVPPVPVGSGDSTQANYTKLTNLSQQQAGNAVYDKAQSAGDTAAIAQQQNRIYNSGGGKKRKSRRYKKSTRRYKRTIRRHKRYTRRHKY
jgi:hypothetical protein